jgi:hypothetical protein
MVGSGYGSLSGSVQIITNPAPDPEHCFFPLVYPFFEVL